MALDKTDLEYIKNTIEWLNEHTELIEDNRTNCEMLYNSVQNSLQALESALVNVDASDSNCTIHGVSGCFSFAKYVNGLYEYSDNTENGDVYNNVVTGKLMTEQQIFDEWLKLNNR